MILFGQQKRKIRKIATEQSQEECLIGKFWRLKETRLTPVKVVLKAFEVCKLNSIFDVYEALKSLTAFPF